MNETNLLLQAAHFAAGKHARQRRKDADQTPYVNHPLEVAALLSQVGGVTDAALLAAALLHDTVEDTSATAEEIQRQFGQEVASLVAEVTDDKSLPKTQRKSLQIEHAPHKTPRAKMLKIADKTCNVRDISAASPAGWPVERKRQYLIWARQVVDGLRGENARLEQEFDAAWAAADQRIAEHE